MSDAPKETKRSGALWDPVMMLHMRWFRINKNRVTGARQAARRRHANKLGSHNKVTKRYKVV